MAQTTRRWLWRLNGVMALVAVVACAWALFGPHDEASPIRLEPAASPQEPESWRPSVEWGEVVSAAQPWLGRWPVAQEVAPPPPAPAPPPGRLPLAAFKVTCHITGGGDPDLIVLKSKDPAHPETYMPLVGDPDGDVAIERIWREEHVVKIAVRRDAETFTYDFIPYAGFEARGIRRKLPGGRERSRASGAANARAELALEPTPPDVKLVPFYGEDGKLLGGRVTGVRPDSRLKLAGLRPGDVVVGIDGAAVASVDRLRMRLRSVDDVRRIDVVGAAGGTRRGLSLGG